MVKYNVKALSEKIQTVVYAFDATVKNRYSSLSDKTFDWDIDVPETNETDFKKYCSKYEIKFIRMSPVRISKPPSSSPARK